MFKINQPGVVLRFQAKEGKGQEFFDYLIELHRTDTDPDGPVDWVMTRDVSDSDVMWLFEFYRDQDSYDRHYSDRTHDEKHQRIIDLLSEAENVDPSVRADVHIVALS